MTGPVATLPHSSHNPAPTPRNHPAASSPNKPPRLIMALPAYNEEENLAALLENLESVFQRLDRLGHTHAYVVVNDGSKDSTPQILEHYKTKLPLTVVTHVVNQGLGTTLRDGLRAACDIASDNDIILTMDADNTHPAGLMVAMVQKILEGHDIVIASRYQPGARVIGLSCFRRTMSDGARVLFWLLAKIPGVRDYTCGFRAYRASVLKRAFERYGDNLIAERGFQCMAEVLLKICKSGLIIAGEVPMILRYDLKGGVSKMRVGSTVKNTLRMLLKHRFGGG